MTEESKKSLIHIDDQTLALLDIGKNRFQFDSYWNPFEAAERLLGMIVEFTPSGTAMVSGFDLTESEVDHAIRDVRELEHRIRTAMVNGRISIIEEVSRDPENLLARPVDIINWAIEQGIPVCEECREFVGRNADIAQAGKPSIYERREAACLEWLRQNPDGATLNRREVHEGLRDAHPRLFNISPKTFDDFWKQFVKSHPEHRRLPGRTPKD